MSFRQQDKFYIKDHVEAKITPAIIEQALQCGLGPEAKKLIIQCIQQKYGMDFELVGQYKTEFENYLRELLDGSAEVIITRIRSVIEDSKRTFATPQAKRRNIPYRKRMSPTVHFLFCDICFWSASLLTTTFEMRCKSCNRELKCALPISSNEAFTYEVSNKRGLSLSFS
jgi:hypothetical protein